MPAPLCNNRTVSLTRQCTAHTHASILVRNHLCRPHSCAPTALSACTRALAATTNCACQNVAVISRTRHTAQSCSSQAARQRWAVDVVRSVCRNILTKPSYASLYMSMTSAMIQSIELYLPGCQSCALQLAVLAQCLPVVMRANSGLFRCFLCNGSVREGGGRASAIRRAVLWACVNPLTHTHTHACVCSDLPHQP